MKHGLTGYILSAPFTFQLGKYEDFTMCGTPGHVVVKRILNGSMFSSILHSAASFISFLNFSRFKKLSVLNLKYFRSSPETYSIGTRGISNASAFLNHLENSSFQSLPV